MEKGVIYLQHTVFALHRKSWVEKLFPGGLGL